MSFPNVATSQQLTPAESKELSLNLYAACSTAEVEAFCLDSGFMADNFNPASPSFIGEDVYMMEFVSAEVCAKIAVGCERLKSSSELSQLMDAHRRLSCGRLHGTECQGEGGSKAASGFSVCSIDDYISKNYGELPINLSRMYENYFRTYDVPEGEREYIRQYLKLSNVLDKTPIDHVCRDKVQEVVDEYGRRAVRQLNFVRTLKRACGSDPKCILEPVK